jgi:uncharacterized protein YaeQ
MALKSTVYRMQLGLSDLNRGHYAQYPLTIARHPSETVGRLMMRVVAFYLFADERLRFGAGLSNAEEPDLVLEDLTGNITLWVEVGMPEPRWVGKALSKSERVSVLVFGGSSARWLKSLEEQFPNRADMPRLQVLQAIPADQAAFERLAERNAQLTCTVQDDTIWLAAGNDTVEVHLTAL